jgi:predicted transcriptional regulator
MKNFQTRAVETMDHVKAPSPSVTEYMTRDLITFTPDMDINEVINSLLKHRISGAPVLDSNGEVVGLIDDKDCLNVLFGSMYNRTPVGPDTVSNYMSNVMKSISVDDNIMDVAYVFSTSPYKRLLVKDNNNKLVGQISRRDILRAIKEMDC